MLNLPKNTAIKKNALRSQLPGSLLMVFVTCLPFMGMGQNLVPNPSFEDNVACPTSNGQIESAEPWIGILGSVDYYHECGTNGFSVPNSWGGGGYAYEGKAYIGLGLRSLGSPDFREYAGINLLDTLIAGKKYKVKFYVSLADSVWYATKSIGAFFSQNHPSNNLNTLLGYEPQVKYEGDTFLTDKNSWTKIEGSFYAYGGENFLTIGNFDNNTNTDTFFVGGADFRPSQPFYWTHAYYYIDDVSVTLDTTYNAVIEQLKTKLNLYPNPNNGNMYLEYENITTNATFELFDITGRKVAQHPLPQESNRLYIPEEKLQPGVYPYKILSDDGELGRGKVVIVD